MRKKMLIAVAVLLLVLLAIPAASAINEPTGAYEAACTIVNDKLGWHCVH